MSNRGKEYEEALLKYIDSLFNWQLKNTPHKVFHRKKYKGKSENFYEIDLSIEFTLMDMNFIIAIECKNHGRKVERSVVSEFVSRLEEIGAQKGLIISTQGFSKGAIVLGNSKSISLATYCNFVYTPLTGDPESRFEYESKIMKYVSINKSPHYNGLLLSYGNAYRSEGIVYLNAEGFGLTEPRITQKIESGFELITETYGILTDPGDFAQIMIRLCLS